MAVCHFATINALSPLLREFGDKLVRGASDAAAVRGWRTSAIEGGSTSHAVDEEAVHLVVLGMQQDRPAVSA